MAPIFRPPVAPPLYPFGANNPPGTFVVTRPFGDLTFPQYGPHDGLDIGNGRAHDPILAIAAGTVTYAAFDPNAGGAGIVRIGHGAGWSSGYAHMDRIDVTLGQNVVQGQPVGILGSTGWVTAAHLHFDITLNGVRQDPWPLLQGDDMALDKAAITKLYGAQLTTKFDVRVRREPNTTSGIIVVIPAGRRLIAPAVVTGQFLDVDFVPTPGNQWYAVWVEENSSTLIGYVHDSTVSEDPPTGISQVQLEAAKLAGFTDAKSKAKAAASVGIEAIKP